MSDSDETVTSVAIPTFDTPRDLDLSSFQAAVELYIAQYADTPSALIVNAIDEEHAHRIVWNDRPNSADEPTIHYVIAPIPDSSWMLVGEAGIVYIPGA